jgi:hypothetical protein
MSNKFEIKEIYSLYYYKWGDSISFQYYGKQYAFDPLFVKELKSFIEQLLLTNNTVNNKDIIYTNSSSEIPRFKLKEFMSKNNIKRTSRMEQSNCFILSKKLIKDLLLLDNLFTDPQQLYFANEEMVDLLLKQWSKDKNYTTKNLNKPKSNADMWLCFNEEYFKHLAQSAKYGKYVKTHFKKEVYNIIYYRNKKNVDLIQLLSFIKTNPNIKIVFDENLITDLNKEGIQLDNEVENVLKDMIYSKDKSNIKLGLEMISNLELNDYTLYKVSLFLNNFINIGNTSQSRSNRGLINQLATNNRNLKTLLNTFKAKEIYWDKDWKSFASGLVKNFTNTPYESLIKEYFIDKLNNEFSSISGVKIEDIKFA